MKMPKRINRREFLRATAAGAALAALGPRVLGEDEASQKPNILLIMSDEHNVGVTGCYGNELIRTPNLDRLAKSGVVFESCYCNSPLCVPSRLSFTSGKHISRVGAWNNGCWLPSADYPSVPRVVNAAGYESFLCGKMHYDATRRYGFQEIGGKSNQSTKKGRGKRRQPDDLTPRPGISSRLDNLAPGESRVLSHDRVVTEAATAFLKNRKSADKPFFLLAGYLAPHFPLVVPEKYWEPYKGKVPMPVIPPGHLESQPRNYKHLRIGFNVEDIPAEIVRKGRELYYGLTQWMDEEIGKLLQALGDSEAVENTVVIYCTDHGENMGEHGLWWKNCLYEHAARSPLIMSWPERWQGGQRRKGACSLLDVAQTVAAIAGGAVPTDWDGDSMVQWLDNPDADWKDLAVSQYYAHNIASGNAMIRTGNYKYVYHTPAGEQYPAERELYDLEADPGEFRNLAGELRHKDRIRSMHDSLVKELGESPDSIERRCLAEIQKGYARPDVKQD